MFQRSLVVALCCLASVALKAQAGAQLRKRVDWNLRTGDFREALRSFETLTGVYFQYDASLTPEKEITTFDTTIRLHLWPCAIFASVRFGLRSCDGPGLGIKAVEAH